MPTTTQILDKITRGRLVQANMSKTNTQKESGGYFADTWSKIFALSWLIQALLTQYLMGDYTSQTTLDIYNNIVAMIGLQEIDGATLDPYAQQTNTIIINTGSNSNFNAGRYTFTNITSPSLSNYAGSYEPLYGDDPAYDIFLDNGDGTFNKDVSTSPVVFANGTIVWSYPFAVSGYISIMGIGTISSGGSGGGGIITPSDEIYIPLTTTGDGISLAFTLPHGQTGITAGSLVWANSANDEAAGNFDATVDDTNVYITYVDETARASGASLVYNVLIKKAS